MARFPRAAFTGPLAEPVRLRAQTSLLNDENDERERYREAVARLYEKLQFLADWYCVAANNQGQIDWRTVCLRLAAELGVPGFQIEEPLRVRRERGRPSKTNDDEWKLLSDVADVQLGHKNISVLAACRVLTNRKGHWHRTNPETLKVRHSEQRHRFKKQFGYKFGSPEHYRAYAGRWRANQGLLADESYRN